MAKIENREDLKNYIHRRLGAPVLKTADLHEEQLDDIIDRSLLRFYEQAVPFAQEERLLVLPVESGKNTYDLSHIEQTPTAVIEEVQGGLGSFWSNINQMFTIENLMFFDMNFTMESPQVTTMQIMMEKMDFLQTMYGISYRGHINEKGKYIQVLPTPKITDASREAVVLFMVYVKVPENDIVQYSWVQDYAVALSMVQIGMNRSKYQGIQLPGGGTLNGDMYFSRGDQELQRLEETLLNEWSEPVDFRIE